MYTYSPTITICGSMRFATEMIRTKEALEDLSFSAHIPSIADPHDAVHESGSDQEAIKRKIDHDFIRKHYALITQSEAILVLNHPKDGVNGYIGGNTLMEIGFAHTLHRQIFLWADPDPTSAYLAEIQGTQPIVIHGDLARITDYFHKLPLALITTESNLKMRALSLELFEAQMPHRIIGKKVPSGVKEEPRSWDETMRGAQGRLMQLLTLPDLPSYSLCVSIEGGQTRPYETFEEWGHHICVIQMKNGTRVSGLSQDLQIPDEWVRLVPDTYPDTGVLVQKMYGATEKDPYYFISQGRLNRVDCIRDAVRRALCMYPHI
jgi:non-canonical (house-cleaning) NTP pyrophosphatase